MFDKTLGRWLDATGPHADIVLSSRIRLARNVAGVNFPSRALPVDQERVVDGVEGVLQNLSIYAPDRFLRSKRLTPVQTGYPVERHRRHWSSRPPASAARCSWARTRP